MARLAKVEVFAADEIAVVHVMTRTVRRCFLPGDDAVTGENITGTPPLVDLRGRLSKMTGGCKGIETSQDRRRSGLISPDSTCFSREEECVWRRRKLNLSGSNCLRR